MRLNEAIRVPEVAFDAAIHCGEHRQAAAGAIDAKERAAELAALKLVRNKLEEHVWRSCSLISIKLAVRSGTVAQEATEPPRATAVPSF